MDNSFLLSDNDDVDFSFVYTLDEVGVNMFFEIIDLAVVEMSNVIYEDLGSGERYLKSLPQEQNLQIHSYYSKLLKLYTDFELYEECEDIKFVIENLEKYQEKVGNMSKKP